MMDYSLSDLKAITEDGNMGNGSWLFFILLIFLLGGNGFGFGGNRGGYTDATTNEILSGQKFDALSRQINAVGDGLASSTFALNNSIKDGNASVAGTVVSEGRSTQEALCGIKFDMANYAASIKENDGANTQKILDAISQSKIDALQSQVNQLQLQNAMQNVVRYPSGWTYNAGTSPFCACGTGCCN